MAGRARPLTADPGPPEILPIFPLTGSLLLPGAYLPLNVFEPRYRNLVDDVRRGSAFIGLVQPLVPRPDNFGVEDPDDPVPKLYEVGCAGRLLRCEPQPDRRFVVLLEGTVRFRIRDELPQRRRYRRVVADYSEFGGDLDEREIDLDPSRLLASLRRFSASQDLGIDFDALQGVSGVRLVNGLCAALPFAPAEKQALLEAPTPQQRQELLLRLLEMGIDPEVAEVPYEPPTLH